MNPSGNQSKTNSELAAFNGVFSGVKDADFVDPRWPLLNRWSKVEKYSTVEIPPFSPKKTGNASSSLISDKVGAAKVIEDQVMVEHLSINLPSSGDMNNRKASTVSSSLGAWKKPMSILSPTPQQETEAMNLHEPKNSDWPALSRDKSGNKTCGQPSLFVKDVDKVSEQSVAQKDSLKAQSMEYPWAARMNQSMRNLHRVTIPEYMEDGTPKVRIPSHVLLGGLENQKEFVVGQFYRCLAPTSGQIQAVVTRIWGRKCRIFTRKLGESTYLFHIPDESTRKWVLQRGLWHVDDCLLFVSPWSPTDTISFPEITTVPVWLTLLNIPDQLYSILGIKWIASGIGEPLLTDKPWLDPTQMGKAKILVELGHKASRCLLLSAQTSPPSTSMVNKGITVSDETTCIETTTTSPAIIPQVSDHLIIADASPSTPVNVSAAPEIVSSPVITTDTSKAMIMSKKTSTTKTYSPSAQSEHVIRRTSSRNDLGSNRFASLDSLEGNETDVSDEDSDPMDLMTPTSKRILRDRPVKPSEKAKEMHWQSAARGRGNRGRGNRGGRG